MSELQQPGQPEQDEDEGPPREQWGGHERREQWREAWREFREGRRS